MLDQLTPELLAVISVGVGDTDNAAATAMKAALEDCGIAPDMFG